MDNRGLDYLDNDVFGHVSWFEKLVDKVGQFRIFWGIVIIVILVGIIECIVIDYNEKHFEVDGISFSYVRSDDDVRVFEDEEENLLEYERGWGHEYIRVNDQVNYMEHVYERVSDSEDFFHYDFFIDGELEGRYESVMVIVNGEEPDRTFEIELIAKASRVASYLDEFLWFYLMGPSVVLAFIAAASIAYPEALWQIEHWWDTEGGEPSEMYLSLTRLGGWLMFAAGFVLPFFIFYASKV